MGAAISGLLCQILQRDSYFGCRQTAESDVSSEREREKHGALRPQKPLRLINDGEVEVGEWGGGGFGNFYIYHLIVTLAVTTRMTPH